MGNNNINTDTILIKKVWLIDKYNFYEYISVMLEWWVWVTESLESVNSKINSPYFKSKIRELITYISSWDSFSKSMKKIPSIFQSSEISIIEAGESTGQLSKALMKLSEDLKKIQVFIYELCCGLMQYFHGKDWEKDIEELDLENKEETIMQREKET